MFWTPGRWNRAIRRRRMREIFKLAIVKMAPRMPPMNPRKAAGRNIITLTGIVLPTWRINKKPTKWWDLVKRWVTQFENHYTVWMSLLANSHQTVFDSYVVVGNKSFSNVWPRKWRKSRWNFLPIMLWNPLLARLSITFGHKRPRHEG